VTDLVVNSNLPIRRLIAAGARPTSSPRLLPARQYRPSWHVALFHWTPAATRFEWGGPGDLTIEDVRNAILSGKIKGPARFW